jgi:mono/diheme cytochrome c family protein
MKKSKIVLTVIIPLFFTLFLMLTFLNGCSSKDEELGIGPVKEIKLAEIDKQLVDKGKQIFETKCLSCHKFDSRLVGPPLRGVTQKRKPEWIMNMILNPQQMTQENKAAKELFAQYLIQMTFQDVSQDDARAILEYFRAVDANQVSAN